jgi:hypothetical protein
MLYGITFWQKHSLLLIMILFFNGGSVWDCSVLPKFKGSSLAQDNVPQSCPVGKGNGRHY